MFSVGAFMVDPSKFSPRCGSGREPYQDVLRPAAESFLRRHAAGFWNSSPQADPRLQSCRPTHSSPLSPVTETMCRAHRGGQSQACAGEQEL